MGVCVCVHAFVCSQAGRLEGGVCELHTWLSQSLREQATNWLVENEARKREGKIKETAPQGLGPNPADNMQTLPVTQQAPFPGLSTTSPQRFPSKFNIVWTNGNVFLTH